MGQRTAIIVKHVDKKTHEEEASVFYHQWGIGRITPINLMTILYGTLSVGYHPNGMTKRLKPQGMSDETEYVNKNLLAMASFDNPKAVGEIMQSLDNNNGGVYVQITTDVDILIDRTVEFAFMLGEEEGGDYEHFCSSDEWIEKAGMSLCQGEFKRLFKDSVSYLGAIEVYSENQ